MNVITCSYCDFQTTNPDPVNCKRCGKCLVTHRWRNTGGPLGKSFEAVATSQPAQEDLPQWLEGWRNGYGDAWRLTPSKEPPTCATCRFYKHADPWPYITTEELAKLSGQCKRRSPSPSSFHPWPLTLPADWCGEHEKGAR